MIPIIGAITGAVATQLVGEGLGLVKDAIDSGGKAVRNAITETTGVDLTKKSLLDKNDIEELRKFEIEQRTWLENIKNARDREIRVQQNGTWLTKNTGSIIALLTVLANFVMYYYVLQLETVTPAVTLIVGILSTASGAIYSYYFGSSKNESDRQRSKEFKGLI